MRRASSFPGSSPWGSPHHRSGLITLILTGGAGRSYPIRFHPQNRIRSS